MKKNFSPEPLAVLMILAGFILNSGTVSAQLKDDQASQIPENINMIFKTSCMGCHGSEGRLLAMAKLNFSKWTEYAPEKKTERARKICSELDEAAMPPKSFRKSKPDLVPSKEQIELICKWAESLRSKELKK